FHPPTATTHYTLSLHDALPISQHDLGPRRGDATLRLAPAGEAHAPGNVAPQDVMMHHEHARLVGRGRGEQLAHALDLRLRQVPLDRKSTRLNSSHQIISYAVFC